MGMYLTENFADNSMIEVVAHPISPGDKLYPHIKVKVEGTDVPVGEMTAGRCCVHFSYDTSKTVMIEVTADENINTYSISPFCHAISGVCGNNRLICSITGQKYIMVKINSLFDVWILCDPLEMDAPKPEDKNVINILDYGVDNTGKLVCTDEINKALLDACLSDVKDTVYIPPGLYIAETIELQREVTLYLSAGAIIKASDNGLAFKRKSGVYNRRTFISCYKANGAKIKGRGVIDGNGYYLRNEYPDWGEVKIEAYGETINCEVINAIQFSQSDSVEIEGIINRYSNRWSTYIHACSNVKIKNYKVFGNLLGKTDDGLDLDSCIHLTVSDSLFNVYDDGLCFKACGIENAPDGVIRDMHDIVAENNVFYIKECPAMKMGYLESVISNIYNILLKGNKVINAREGITIRPKGNTVCYNWKAEGNYYQNITNQNYRLDPESKHSYNISFSGEKHVKFGAYNSTVYSNNVNFHNLEIGGKICLTQDDAHVISGDNIVKFYK